jgi:uncharacterized membrane protein YfcA
LSVLSGEVSMLTSTLACPYFRRAFGWCIPIGDLGGLIGLGGGEFRLPLLMHVIGFDARSAAPLNLTVSFVTLSFALVARSHSVSLSGLLPHAPEIGGLLFGGIVAASYGVGLVRRLSSASLIRLIAMLLFALGCLLLAEAVFPFEKIDLIPHVGSIHFVVGAGIGFGIGLVSSILGVAGGELLIPTLLFLFGADIKTAGSASILISLGIVAVGLWRYWQIGAVPRGRGIQRLVSAMGAGSIIGATIGGLAVAYAPVEALKLLLGLVLVPQRLRLS